MRTFLVVFLAGAAHAFVPLGINRPSVVPPVPVKHPALLRSRSPAIHRVAATPESFLDAGFAVATTAADYEFGGSYASLYATLALFVVSFPGIISLVTRSVKVKIDQRTFVLPGPAVEGAKPLRQVAAEVMAYFQANNYKVCTLFSP